MDGRKFVPATVYRYSFNGKEGDPENGGDLDFGTRIYNSRLGRFLSVDPDAPKYPDMSSFCFAANNPIMLVDQDGRGPRPTTGMGLTGYRFSSWFGNGTSDYFWNSYKSPGYNIVNRFVHSAVGDVVGGTIDGAVFFATYTWSHAQTGGNPSYIMWPQSNPNKYYRYDLHFGLTAYHYKPMNQFSTEEWISYIGGAATFLSVATEAVVSVNAYKVATVAEREALAKGFYAKEGYDAGKTANHLRGIDFQRGVQTSTLEEGIYLEQWAKLDANGNPIMGDYFTLPNENPAGLGLPLEGRVKVTVQLTEKTEFLKSKCASGDVFGNGQWVQGGSTQLFKANAKYKITSIGK
jgi:RHS repeat-associated protein